MRKGGGCSDQHIGLGHADASQEVFMRARAEAAHAEGIDVNAPISGGRAPTASANAAPLLRPRGGAHAPAGRLGRRQLDGPAVDTERYIMDSYFEGHEARVAKRRQLSPGAGAGMTPAERLAAIRRRVASRAMASRNNDTVEEIPLNRTSSSASELPCRGKSIEDCKIHHDGDHRVPAAVADAASYRAWHHRESLNSPRAGGAGS